MAGRQGEGLTYDPWVDAGQRYPEWEIRRVPLRGMSEAMCLQRRVILLDDSLDRAGRRSALAHSIAHLDLGHLPSSGWHDARQELHANRLAALRLVPARELAQAISWCGQDWPAVAVELDVDVATLATRLECLHPAEAGLLTIELEIHHEEHIA